MTYKKSRYNVVVKRGKDDILLHNVKSGYTIKIDEKNAKIFDNLEFLSDINSTKAFYDMGYIVEEEKDEITDLFLENMKVKYDSSRMDITVQTTNQCNFRCPYCYQDHTEKELDENFQSILVKFLRKQIENGVRKLKIHWFGGEPLLNTKAIFYIEDELRKIQQEHGELEIEDYMTTNGYFLTEELYEHIVTDTNIKSIQITIDGKEELHNRTRVSSNNGGTYRRIIENIKKCLKKESDITFIIRQNINRNNVLEVEEFLQQLEDEKILYHDRVQVSFHQAVDYSNQRADVYFHEKREYMECMIEVYKKLLERGLGIPRFSNAKYCNCLFDCINTYLITPDLKIQQCSSETEKKKNVGVIDEFGNAIFNENYYHKMSRNILEKEKCRNCFMLPVCYGGCYNLESIKKDECVPEKYMYTELIKLYALEGEKKKGNNHV